ncbi:hypothetical protein GGG16DRAFT_35801, partial [Schizophyllum commune]
RVNLAVLPWSIREARDPQPLRESVRKTLDILENISREPRVAKSSLLNNARRPQFPNSEWENILGGNAVNLDTVVTSEYSLSIDFKTTEKIGDFEVSLTTGSSAATPSKVVKSHSDYLIAWDRTVEAYEYIFEHRHHELQGYTRHILQLFKSFPEELHSRVINYDKAVRLRVAARRDLLLTDFNEFSDLHLQWIQNSLQVRVQRDSNSKQRAGAALGAGGRRRDPCNRWNSGVCPNSTGKCRYAHVCSVCRSNQHAASACT